VLPLDYLKETRNRDVRAAQEAAEYDNAETGRRAGLMALARAGLKASDIGMVIAGGCSPDSSIPAEASRIAAALDIDAPALDLHAACSSFGAQLHFLAGMRPEFLPDHVLVVNPENSTRVVDYSDRSSCVLWGDGTSAAIVSPRHPGRWRVTDTLLEGQPAGWDKVQVPRIGHFTQRGAAVGGPARACTRCGRPRRVPPPAPAARGPRRRGPRGPPRLPRALGGRAAAPVAPRGPGPPPRGHARPQGAAVGLPPNGFG